MKLSPKKSIHQDILNAPLLIKGLPTIPKGGARDCGLGDVKKQNKQTLKM
jgi:hypothetical protein